MNRVKIFMIMLMMMTSVGCSAQNTHLLTGKDLQMPGYGFADYGYQYDLLGEQVLPHKDDLQFVARYDQDSNLFNGGYTQVSVVFHDAYDGGNQVNLPIMYLQHFDKSQLAHQPNAKITIKNKRYSPDELKDCIIFENKRVIIYDFTRMIIGDSIESYVQKFINTHLPQESIKDYAWIADDYHLLSQHHQALISTSAPLAAPTSDFTGVPKGEENLNVTHKNRTDSGHPLSGYDLVDMQDAGGYFIALPQGLDDLSLPGFYRFDPLEQDINIVSHAHDKRGNFVGNYTTIELIIQDKNRKQYLPIMYLQHFFQADLARSDAFIQVAEKQYQPNELRRFIIFENELSVVYDFTELIIALPFEQYLADASINTKKNAVNWTKQCYEFLRNNRQDLIRPCLRL